MIPTSKARVNGRIVAPPNRVSALKVKITVSDVFSERAMVCTRLAFTTWSNVSEVRRCMFSRMRSNTTIESCTEKPTTVNKAVINRASIWKPINQPRIEKTPSTTSTSCNSATTALVPYRHGLSTLRKENQIQSRINTEAARTAKKSLRVVSDATEPDTIAVADCCI